MANAIQQKLWAVINDEAATDGEKDNALRALDNLDASPTKRATEAPFLWHIASELTHDATLCGAVRPAGQHRYEAWTTRWRWIKDWGGARLLTCPVCYALAAHEVRQLEKPRKQLAQEK